MGLFDLAGPALTWLDRALAAAVPDAGRLVLWGLFAAAVSMALYAVLSPQHRLRRVREDAVAARHALDQHEGSFEEARPLMARMFATSMKQLGLVLMPAVVASLPMLFMLTWLYGAFSYTLPDQPGAVDLRTAPTGYEASIRPSQLASSAPVAVAGAPTLVVQDGRGRVVDERPLSAPVTTLHKERWWNVLIANPIGYLADDSPLELVEIDLPRREVLSVGPWWMRTWEFVFFTTLVAASLAIKLLFRLV
ncbi:MAG: hypothetical protein ACM35H_11775 [Bacteroidota bacterium]|nr:hypothetical protein [Kiloniellaceae bacterium]